MKKLAVVFAIMLLLILVPTANAVTPELINRDEDNIVQFAVKGDWGNLDASYSQADVTVKMCELRELTGYRYVLTVGDNFQQTNGIATDEVYYIPEECLYSHPDHWWRAAWGNHDYGGTDTHNVLGAPIDQKYYWWRTGDVAFFVYDSGEFGTIDEAQRLWLYDKVCTVDAKVKILYGHMPPYSPTQRDHGAFPSVTEAITSIAEECGISVVFSGHSHLYARTVPIHGVTYIITGGGGAPLHYPSCAKAPEPEMWAYCIEGHHFVYVEVDSMAIHLTAIVRAGASQEVYETVDIPVR